MNLSGSMRVFVPILLIYVSFIAGGCNKVKIYANNNAGAAFINAVPDTSFDAVDTGFLIRMDTSFRSNPIPYLGTAYILIQPGTWNVQVRSSIDSSTTFFEAATEELESNKAVSYFIYDTLSTTDSILNVVKLTDDLTPPPAGILHFRFLNLAVNSSPLDVTLTRTAPLQDSITIQGQVYIGDTPDANALSVFNRQIPLGLYTISLKEAGTQNILASGPIDLSDIGIYTFYATGLASGMPLTIGVVRHFP
jgi:hypothetical protein